MQNSSLGTQGISFIISPELLMDVNDPTRVLLFAAQYFYTSQSDRGCEELERLTRLSTPLEETFSLVRLFEILAHLALLLNQSIFFKSDQMCHGDQVSFLLNIMSKAMTY